MAYFRGKLSLLSLALSATSLALIPVLPAGADPLAGPNPTATPNSTSTPATAADALSVLHDLSRQAEETTEALHGAQSELDTIVEEQKKAEEQVAFHQQELTQAQTELNQLQRPVDSLTMANYEGARTNRLYAMLASSSPQQFLDQMSMLDLMNKDTKGRMDSYAAAAATATTAKQKAEEIALQVRDLVAQAEVKRAELQGKQSELQSKIASVTAQYESLTEAEREAWSRPAITADVPSISSDSPEAKAVDFALSKRGRPYVWGATGPDAFDCSGLVYWAYKQVGKNVPRTSQEQGRHGAPVLKGNLQPGDVVTYYHGSHAAMYVGVVNGKETVIHAPDFGQPVQLASLFSMPVDEVRHY